MRHCSTRELDLWRVTLGRSETGEASSQAPLGGVSANWIKVEVQCSSVLWNSSQGCFPSPGLLGSPPHPLTPLQCGDWTSECSKESSLVACTSRSAVINLEEVPVSDTTLWFIHRHSPPWP